jgi:hypothetical protein
MSGFSNLPPAAGPMPRMDLSRPPRGGRALFPPPSRPGYFTARYITPGMVQCNINTALQKPAIYAAPELAGIGARLQPAETACEFPTPERRDAIAKR